METEDIQHGSDLDLTWSDNEYEGGLNAGQR